MQLAEEVRNGGLWVILVSSRGHLPSPAWEGESPSISLLGTLPPTSACGQWARGSGNSEGPFTSLPTQEALSYLRWAKGLLYSVWEAQSITSNSVCWFNMFITSPKTPFLHLCLLVSGTQVLRGWIWEPLMCFVFGDFSLVCFEVALPTPVQKDLQLSLILLPQSPKSWDYKTWATTPSH